MKKNIFSVLVMLLAFCCLFVGCDNLVNNEAPKDDNNDNETSVTVGWYEYTTNANSDYPQSTILYINESGNIERAGSIDNEYSGQQLEMLQNQLSYSICKKNADGVVIIFVSTNEPIWAYDTTDDNSNNDLESEDGNSPTGDNNNDNETNIPSEDNEPEITLPSGYEWWCFEKAVTNYNYYYVLYNNNEAVRCGVETHEMEVNELYKDKNLAIEYFNGNKYQITDLTKLPAWALN